MYSNPIYDTITDRDRVRFRPTFLYIKQHSVTGKLYFGKTTRDVSQYHGSGKYWLDHMKKHGRKHVHTLWYCLFMDIDTLVEFAISFSLNQHIVESTEWANLRIENGLEGGWHGRPASAETRKKLSNALLGKRKPQRSAEHTAKLTPGLLHTAHKKGVGARCVITQQPLGKVSKDDPRWDTGEIVPVARGRTAAVVTQTGQPLGLTLLDDPRWLSGEIVSLRDYKRDHSG